MYLHAGGNVVVRKKDIIGIFDIDNMNTEETMKNFLRQAEKKGESVICTEALPKSFILVKGENGEKIIYSSISAQRLVQRGLF